MVSWEDALTFLKKSWYQLNDLPMLAHTAVLFGHCLSRGSLQLIVEHSNVLNCKSRQMKVWVRFSYSYIWNYQTFHDPEMGLQARSAVDLSHGHTGFPSGHHRLWLHAVFRLILMLCLLCSATSAFVSWSGKPSPLWNFGRLVKNYTGPWGEFKWEHLYMTTLQAYIHFF